MVLVVLWRLLRLWRLSMSEMDEDERRREKRPRPDEVDVRLSRVCTGCCCGGGTGSWFLWPKRGMVVLFDPMTLGDL